MKKEKRQEFYEKALYPCVRVRAAKAGGSGQVIHSSEKNGIFVLTCEHVIEGCVEVKEEWSNLQQRSVKRDILSPVQVEFFHYIYSDRFASAIGVDSTIVCYDKNEDVALLRLDGEPPGPVYVASLLDCDGPEDKSVNNKVDYMADVITVGAAMGETPIATRGELCGFNKTIEQKEYWLSTAPSIFGNSGGATFLADTWELVGMPARITVSATGFSADAITHMGYVVPVTRIVKFLKDNMMEFFFDDSVTYDECKERIKKKREKAELEILQAAMKGEK